VNYKKNPLDAETLRQLALERFGHPKVDSAGDLSAEQSQGLLEDLAISKIELELQNEHLNATRAQLELALSQSTELYDFAPVGCFSTDGTGLVVKLNLAGARLLGQERARILGTRFDQFFPESERSGINTLLRASMESGDVRRCEVALLDKNRTQKHMQVELAPLGHGLGCHAILVDITERKQLEQKLRESEARWKFALDAVGDGVWDWDVRNGAVTYSSRFAQLYGFDSDEFGIHVESWSSRIHPDDRQRVMAALQRCLTGNAASYSNEYRGQCKDGSWKWILARGAVFSRDVDGAVLRMIGTHTDVTVRKQMEETVQVVSGLQQAVFDSLPFYIAVLDRDGNILQTNAVWKAYAAVNGFGNRCGFVGASYSDVLETVMGGVSETIGAASVGIAAVMSREQPSYQLEYAYRAAGETRWFVMKVSPVSDGQGRVVVSHQDVSSLKEAELTSLRLANYDDLTGALSRRNFLEVAEREWMRSTRYQLPLMALAVDLDRFKTINDENGHSIGDAILKNFVQVANEVLRESDVIGRMGGDEFAVLLPNTTLEGGRALALRIVDKVSSSPVEVDGRDVSYTVSIGGSCLLREASFADLFKRADAALYQAKNGGRDRVAIDTSGTPCLW